MHGVRSVVCMLILLSVCIFPFSHAASKWGYHGDIAPAQWCHLDDTFKDCCDGMKQSPIDIIPPKVQAAPLDALKFDYKPTALEIIHNGHTVQANVPKGSNTLLIGDQAFQLLQYHVHTPSEHLVDGGEYPVEVHLVHQAEDGTLAVVGVLLEEGSAHQELDTFWKALPYHQDLTVSVKSFDINKLIPANKATYRYSGSLTTPPCGEGVLWHVMAEPLTLSAEQIEAIHELFSGEHFPDGNRRPVQPLNDRAVKTEQ